MDFLCPLNSDCTKCVKWPIICPLVSAASFAQFESCELAFSWGNETTASRDFCTATKKQSC